MNENEKKILDDLLKNENLTYEQLKKNIRCASDDVVTYLVIRKRYDLAHKICDNEIRYLDELASRRSEWNYSLDCWLDLKSWVHKRSKE